MPNFLIVDDDPSIVSYLMRLLARAFPLSHSVSATNGNEALHAAQIEGFDVILLDVNLPGKTGFEICSEFKSSEKTARIPIILITGERMESANRAMGLDLGADGYLYKPFVPEELTAQIRVMLRIKAAEDHLRSQKESLEEAFQKQTIELQQNKETLQLKVQDLTAMLEKQTQDLIKTDRLASIGILAAGVAHEVNNPNTFIASNLQTFKMFWKEIDAALVGVTLPEPERRQRLAFVREEMPGLIKGFDEGTKRIAAIVSGIKSYAASSSGHHRVVNLAGTIESAMQLVWNQIKHDIVVVRKLPENIPRVFGSEQHLCQVFVNLFLNAAHAMKEHRGEGTLTIEGYTDDQQCVVIAVQDTGHGIRPEDQRNLFSPFFTTRREKGGTGLGLFVCHGIIKGHNGRLEVESEWGRGTTFKITLPQLDINQAVEVEIESHG